MKSKRYGIILVERNSKNTLVLSRINYALYNRLNNNIIPYENDSADMILSMYYGCNTIYEFPKGVREKGETPFNCAKREFFEETGIFLDSSSVLANIAYTYTAKNNKTYPCYYYVVDAQFSISKHSTTILKTSNLPILSDNFNIVIYTCWYKIRYYFLNIKLFKLVAELDEIFAYKGHSLGLKQTE